MAELRRFGDFATFKYGKMPDKKKLTESGKYPVYSGYRYVGYYDEYNTEANQIIVVARGVGGTGDVKLTKERCYLTNLSISADIDENIALPEFIYYYYLPHNLRYLDSGSAQSQITISDLEKVMIPLPSLGEQRAICGYMKMLDRKIEINEAVNENLEQQARALFHAMFIASEERIDWDNGVFADLIESTLGGDWGKESPSGNNTEMVYCIRGADIPNVKAGNKGKMPTRYILPKNYAAKRLLPGDIVVEISGGSPTQSTGRVAAVSQSLLDRYDKGMVCTNFCRAIKPKAGYSMFIYYYWQHLYDRNVFFSYENGTTGIKNLDLSGFITSEEIVIPPIELVQRFDMYCQTMFDQIFANGFENEQLATIRDTLLPSLMSGELDVSGIEL